MCKLALKLFAALFLFGIAGVYSLPANVSEIKGSRLISAGFKKFHIVSYDRKNWHDALQTCHLHGMEMAAINSRQENDEVLNVIKAAGIFGQPVWTGGNDLADNGFFTWVTTGKPFTSSYWTPGEPNNLNGNQHCVHFYPIRGYYAWDDDDCARKDFFVCEMKY